MTVPLQNLLRRIAIRAMLATERLQSGVVYNPLSAPMSLDPYPKYGELRTKDPVHWSILAHSWVFSRYEDVDAILRDHRRFSNNPRNRRDPRRLQPSTSFPRRNILFLDPPDHTRLRSLVNKAFTPGAIEALKLHIREIIEKLLDQIEDPASFDVMEAVAHPLPVIVIAELLGVPPEDRVRFAGWSHRLARTLEPMISEEETQDALQAANHFGDYFRGIIDERRAKPRPDLISALVAAEELGDKLDQNELLLMLRLLLVAGNETTTNLIGNGLLALMRHPRQMQMLREEPSLMESAVEELLRYDSPVQVDARAALEDMKISSRHIKRGQGIIALIGSANHDPEVFSHPERLDITRKEASNIAFGRGIHHCLGAPLARIEARIAFEAMLRRFSEIRLATDLPLFKDNLVLRGLEALPVAAKKARH